MLRVIGTGVGVVLLTWAVVSAQPPPSPPPDVVEAQRRAVMAYCRAQVYLPTQIVVPSQIDGATQIVVELPSQSTLIVTTAAELRVQAGRILAGEQTGFQFGP